MIPQIIQDSNFSDHPRTISYVNDFSFQDIERFYIISNSANSKLISFSTLPLVNVNEGDISYPSDYWKINGK